MVIINLQLKEENGDDSSSSSPSGLFSRLVRLALILEARSRSKVPQQMWFFAVLLHNGYLVKAYPCRNRVGGPSFGGYGHGYVKAIEIEWLESRCPMHWESASPGTASGRCLRCCGRLHAGSVYLFVRDHQRYIWIFQLC